MCLTKANIISQLQKDILPLQGLKAMSNHTPVDMGLGPIKYAFPNAVFPMGATHEFFCDGAENMAATGGFIAGIATALMNYRGACLWISTSSTVFPPALKLFGIDPERIIFVNLQKETDVLLATEEALTCDGLAAVVAEMRELSFTASRRLQLAVEQSRVTGFILRHNSRNVNTTACVTRWKISALASAYRDNMPGIGFPRWNVELLKVRNGKPGNWQVEWSGSKFKIIPHEISTYQQQLKKTG